MLVGTLDVPVTVRASISVRTLKTDAGTVTHANTQRKNQLDFHSGEKVERCSWLALPLHNTATKKFSNGKQYATHICLMSTQPKWKHG